MDDSLKQTLVKELKQVSDMQSLNQIKVNYFGKNGIITKMNEQLKEMDDEHKKEYGVNLNNLKSYFLEMFTNRFNELNELEINKKIATDKIDISLPSTNIKVGAPSIISKVLDEIETLFISMGYDVETGPEVEKDLYNFEYLNLPKGHPARDAQDTFYIKDEEMLLRSQTSPVQIRTMLNNKEKTPIRIICPGKTYRRDEDDATHSHQFMQVEALLVDKNISLADLKGTCDMMAGMLFGSTNTRFRPSYYPFTEPSVEYDVECFKCHGKGCEICKQTGWITIGGAGVVHPNVLKNCGYDPDLYTGFAFGFGVERMAMLKYGINDIRLLYTNDLRVAPLFDKGGNNNEN